MTQQNYGDEVDIDLSNYKDRVGGRVPPSRYRVVVEDAEYGKAGSGNMMVTLWLRVVGGQYDGAVIIDRLVQAENSMFRTVGFMQAIGLPTPKKRLRINLRQFIGKALDVDVDDGDPYLGKVKSEVRGYMQAQRSGDAPVVSDLPLSEEEKAEGMAVFTGDDETANGAQPVQPEERDRETAAQRATPAPDTSQAPDEVDLDRLDLG